MPSELTWSRISQRCTERRQWRQGGSKPPDTWTVIERPARSKPHLMRKSEIERAHAAKIASFVEQHDRDENQNEDEPKGAGPRLRNRPIRARRAGLEAIEIRRCVARARPYEGDDPADQRPTQEKVEEKDREGRQMPANQRDHSRQEIEQHGNDQHRISPGPRRPAISSRAATRMRHRTG